MKNLGIKKLIMVPSDPSRENLEVNIDKSASEFTLLAAIKIMLFNVIAPANAASGKVEPVIEPSPENIEKMEKITHTDLREITRAIAYGKVYIKTLTLAHYGQYHNGHRHNFDHITNIIRGSVLCEVEGCDPKVFAAPAQITIAADKWHKFTALENDVIYQCIYHQPERSDIYTLDNSPYGHAPFTKEEVLEQFAKIDNPCASCGNCES